jgi:protein gp37
MGKDSGIDWTDRTWGVVTGCDRISRGCDFCYALSLSAELKAQGAKRYQNDGNPETSGPGFDVTLHHDLLDSPKFWRDPAMVFVNSMSDLFHARVPLDFVSTVFATMDATPQHTYQVLTKRAARLPKIVDKLDWPTNLWMGVSVEDEAAMSRIEQLKAVPASVRFLSCEPLLGPMPNLADHLDGIDWVIAGGESGENARPMDVQWARDIREACLDTGTAFWFKQFGGRTSKSGGKILDGAVVEQWPTPVDRKVPAVA